LSDAEIGALLTADELAAWRPDRPVPVTISPHLKQLLSDHQIETRDAATPALRPRIYAWMLDYRAKAGQTLNTSETPGARFMTGLGPEILAAYRATPKYEGKVKIVTKDADLSLAVGTKRCWAKLSDGYLFFSEKSDTLGPLALVKLKGAKVNRTDDQLLTLRVCHGVSTRAKFKDVSFILRTQDVDESREWALALCTVPSVKF
jgi:hypothetical protein